MAFCTNCGTEYVNKIRFCSNCGTNLESAQSVVNTPVVQQAIPAADDSAEELRTEQLQNALMSLGASLSLLAASRQGAAGTVIQAILFMALHEDLQQLLYPLVPEQNPDDIFSLLVESPETYRTNGEGGVIDFNGKFSLLTLSGVYMFEKNGSDFEPIVMQEWVKANEDPILEFWYWDEVPGKITFFLGEILETYIWGGKFDFTETSESEYMSLLVDAKLALSDVKRIAAAPTEELVIHAFDYDDGTRYVGTLSDGIPSGYGTMTYPNGDIYMGEFANGKRWGFGNYLYKAGGNLNGQWMDGDPHGLGSQVFGGEYEGHRYDGEFFGGQRSGTGTYTFPNGAQQVGTFDNGVFVE
jgi:hypothetical protein